MMQKAPRISYLLKQLQLANYQRLDNVLRDFGLTPSQYIVLWVVSDHQDGLFSAALARRLGVAPQSSNEIVASLESRELIRRVEDAGPRRVLRLRLTVKGRALLAKCEKAVDRFEADFFAALSSEEEQRLHDMLSRLVRDSREKAARDGLETLSGRARSAAR